MTEEGIEAPHAHMQHEKLRQRAASRAWQACTNRLGNNLEVHSELQDLTPAFCREWRLAKRVLQVDPDRQHRPMKVTFKKHQSLVYRSTPEVPTFGELRAKAALTVDGSMPLTYMQHVAAEYLQRTFRQQGFYTIGLPEETSAGEPPDIRAFQVVWIVSPSAEVLRRPEELKTPSLDLGIQWLEARKFEKRPPLLEVFVVGRSFMWMGSSWPSGGCCATSSRCGPHQAGSPGAFP